MKISTAAITAMIFSAMAHHSASAQAADAPGLTAPQAAATTSGYSDADLTKFAALAVKINSINQAGGADAQTKMVEAVQTSGLSFEVYNAIAAKMQSDTALQKRVSELAPKPQS